MLRKNKRIVLSLFAFLLALVGGLTFGGCSKGAKSNIAYINNVEDFNLKFQTEKVVYVDDLDFGTDTKLEVNRSVKFVGKKEKSTLSKLFINITAPNVGGERIKVEFENIIFDGGFDKGTTDITQEDSFENILGNRENKNCITACRGHYDLTINNCEFTNYASEYGSVVYVDNDLDSPDYKVITISNSKFYNNICKRGTLDIFHDKAKTKITNCDFYGNYGATGTGFNVGNGKLFVDNCVVKDNNFCKFDIEDASGQTAGGGVSIGAFDGKMSNTKIINNKSVFGGGLAVVSNPFGDNKMIIENCTIKNNTATKNGGGVIINSKAGQTVSFIGCEISFNKAPSSASVYSIPMQGWNLKDSKGNLIKTGNINFFFCKIAMNEGMDNKGITTDLDYYVSFNPTELPNASQKGNTQIKGCIIIDETTLTANEGDYNYIATPAKAQSDGVIDTTLLADMEDKNLNLLINRKAKIVVPARVYSSWHSEFAGATKSLKAGNYVRYKSNTALIVSLTAGLLAALVASAIIIVNNNKKKKAIISAKSESFEVDNKSYMQNASDKNNLIAKNKNAESKSYSSVCYNELEIKEIMEKWDLISTLSKKEKEVFALRLAGKRRKDIAKEQFVSENTIKKQLLKIYMKLEVASGKELLESASKYLNS